MITTLGVAGAVTATLHGFGAEGLAAMAAEGPFDRAVMRPPSLKGKVLEIDPATALSAAACARLRPRMEGIADHRIGIVVASRIGNYQILNSFSGKVRRGGRSPVQFSGSGYNVCAGVAAMAAGVNGPSLALAGGSANLGDALGVAAFDMLRGDADAMIVGVVAVEPGGKVGAATFLAVTATPRTGAPALRLATEPVGEVGAEPATLPLPGTAAASLLARLPELVMPFSLVMALDGDAFLEPGHFDFPDAAVVRRVDLTHA
ncbi:hypothetical protein N825_09770 [Skermanella stibiiresistens SB22]|uniref:Beta-ketoacyl synthase-like N-terminal domain-containing protein n=1 Tax=Skermanella stibiiresistens SB22 TaxID=1385369 RepID=W9GS40_9PROT|nr:beta-ketoacyl synthase N-terminal-like domain-containing protein [Skermanella stibiiresistens]EWY36599.1 hypothetical protein N825_09770 [Skermanella stibiiresistens SB22]